MIRLDDVRNTIIQGSALESLKTFPSACVDEIVTSPPYWTSEKILDKITIWRYDITMETKRDERGRYIKGQHYAVKTEFKKGQHWRTPKPYWNREWLYKEYVEKRKPATQIAKEQKCDRRNILFFLKKLNIPIRTTKEIRAMKYWGAKGKDNPAWKGGVTPINQRIRNSIELHLWREAVFARDNWTCQKCGARSGNGKAVILHVHHKKSFANYPKLRVAIDNGITLCKKCHKLTDNYGGKNGKGVMPNGMGK